MVDQHGAARAYRAFLRFLLALAMATVTHVVALTYWDASLQRFVGRVTFFNASWLISYGGLYAYDKLVGWLRIRGGPKDKDELADPTGPDLEEREDDVGQ